MKKTHLVLFLVFLSFGAGAQTFLDENFNAGMPANFIIQNGGSTQVDTWQVVPFHQEGSAQRTLNGTPFLFVNGDLPDPQTFMDEYLTTPAMNTSAASQVFLQFNEYYKDYNAVSANDSANIEVFDGVDWIKVLKQAGPLNQGNWIVPKLIRIDLTPYKNSAMKLRFYFTGLWPYYWAIDNMRVFVPQPKDVGPVSVVLPAKECGFGASVPLKIKVTNFGTAAQSGFPISYRVNGGTPVTETFTANLSASSSVDYTFTNQVSMAIPGSYKIDFWTGLVGDVGPENDTLKGFVLTKYAEGFPIQEFNNYDGSNLAEITPGWKESRGLKETGKESNWTRSSQAQQISFGSISAKVNLFGNSQKEWIISPTFKPSATTGLIFKCSVTDWNASQGDFMGSDDTLKIKVTSNCGTSWKSVFFLNAASGLTNQYRTFIVPLAQYANQEIRVAFYATEGNVNNEEDYDIHIDDINIQTLPSSDIGVVGIKNPTSNCGLTSPLVTVSVRNFGAKTVKNFNIKYKFNNQTAVNEMVLDSLTPNQVKDFTFNQPANINAIGVYNFSAWTSFPADVSITNDSTTNHIVENSLAISTFPYLENFENGAGGWKSTGTVSSWALGTPQKTIINTPAEGLNSWVTGGLETGTYNTNERSYVQSPCFNFTNLLNPVIDMKVWWHSEANRDGALIQYSINGGTNWRNVGLLDDPNNWYNTETIPALSFAPVSANPQSGWSGGVGTDVNGSGGWVSARNFVKLAAGEPVVKFRISFASNGSFNGDGFGFDKVAFYEGPTKDIELQEITSPRLSTCQFGPNYPIKIKLTNKGTQAVTSVPVTYQINSLPPVTETITTSIDTNQTFEYTFTHLFDFSNPGSYNIKCWTSLPNDDIKDNDSILFHRIAVYSNGLDTLKFDYYTGSNLTIIYPGWREAKKTPQVGEISNWTRSSANQTSFYGSPTARLNLASNINREWLISPQILCESTTRLSFQIARTKANETTFFPLGPAVDDSVLVRISTNCGSSWTTLRYFNKDSTLTQNLRTVKINLGAYAGQKIIIGFYGSDGIVDNVEDYDIHIRKVLIVPSPANDLAMGGLVSPIDPCGLSSSQILKVKVVNNGVSAQSNYQIAYQVNSNAPVFQNVTTQILPDQESEISFIQPFNFSQPGTYNIKVWTKLSSDAVTFNDTSRSVLKKYGAPTALLTFNGYGGQNLTEVSAGWSEAKGSPPVFGNSLWDAQTFGSNTVARIFIAGSSKNEWLVSPVIRLAEGNKLRFLAAVRIPGTNSPGTFDIDDRVNVLVTNNCGQTWIPILVLNDSVQPALNENFTQYEVALDAYDNQEVRLAFQAKDGTRENLTSDFLIDNIQVVNPNSFTDLSALQFVSPGAVMYAGQINPVKVRLKNIGTSLITNGLLSVSIDDNNFSRSVDAIAPNAFKDIELGEFMPNEVGTTYGIAYISSVVDDNNQLNDTIRLQWSVLVAVDPILAFETDFHIFPNPVPDYLLIETETDLLVPENIQITDLLGKALDVKVHDFEKGKFKADLRDLPTGIYILNLKVGERLKSFKVLKD